MKKKILIIILSAVLVLGGAAAFILTRPAIKFTTKTPEIELGSSFDPLSVVETAKGDALSEIQISGPSELKETGSYKYSYSLKNKSYEIELKVVDTTPPEITVREELVFTDRDEIKAEMIAEATDLSPVMLSLDCGTNDITKIGNYNINVIAEDSAGNKTTAPALITVEAYDKEAPSISGLGDLRVPVGEGADLSYGVSVKDDKDENPSLTIDNSAVDFYTCGTYEAVYVARDEYGNETRRTRTITVYEKKNGGLYYPSSSDACWNCESNGYPFLIAVNRSLCCVTVYTLDSDGYYTVPYKAMICSVGKDSYYNQTPLGRFTCGWRAYWCSMLGDYVHYGRYATWINTYGAYYPDGSDVSGIMFHTNCYLGYEDITTLEYDEYNKLGTPASLGCVRLTVSDAKWLFENCADGTIVVVYEDPTSPGPLGKPELRPIDTTDEARRGWEPTDPDPANPWNN